MNDPFFPDPVFAWTFFLVLVAITSAAAVVDLRTWTIPKWLTLPALALGVLFNVARGAWLGAGGQVKTILWLPVENSPWLGALDGLLFAVVGFLLGFGMFFVMWVLKTCRGGDVKLFAAVGTWGGVTLTVILLAVTILFVMVLFWGRLFWVARRRGFRRAAKDYSMKRPTRQGKPSATHGYVNAQFAPERWISYSLSVALSIVVVFLWTFRAELRLVPANPSPAKMEMTGGKNLLARLGR